MTIIDTKPNLPPQPNKLRAYAFKLLASRELSVFELKQKLVDIGASDEAIESVLAELISQNYINDQRVGEMLVRQTQRTGRGPLRLKMALDKKGVSLEVPIEVNWLQTARETRIKKFGEQYPTDAKDKAKQLRFLVYRGFNFDVANCALTPPKDE